MRWLKLENKIIKRLTIQRIILIILSLICVITSIVFFVLYENSKEVTVQGTLITFEVVTYNFDYLLTACITAVTGPFILFCFIVNLLYCKHATASMGKDVITIYRGIFCFIVYVNGDKIGSKWSFSYTCIIESRLSDNTFITVSPVFKRTTIAHISFSDGTESLYL